MKCFRNVIRLRKRNYKRPLDYEIIVISTKCKVTSKKVVERLGYVRMRSPKEICVNFQRMSYYLNNGVKIHSSVRKYLTVFCC